MNLKAWRNMYSKVIQWWSVKHLCVSWLSNTSTDTTFLSKATGYFSYTRQRREAKNRRKESLLQPDIVHAISRSRVMYATYELHEIK